MPESYILFLIYVDNLIIRTPCRVCFVRLAKCQSPCDSILLASCNRFSERWSIWHLRMCTVTQITCAKGAEFCKDETLRPLAEQRQSNMQVWNCTACGTCAQFGCISSRVWPIRCLSRSSNANIWIPTCTVLAWYATVHSAASGTFLCLLRPCLVSKNFAKFFRFSVTSNL